MDNIIIPEPPPSACGYVKEGGVYVRGAGGGGWGGGKDGTGYLIVAVFPAPGDETGLVTGTQRTTLRIVDADAVLANEPEEDWLIAQSRVNHLEKRLAEGADSIFGMPAKRRLNKGFLEGVTDPMEAQQRLLALQPDGEWRQVGRAINQLSRLTVDAERFHPLVMAAWAGFRAGKPWKVLAHMHELLDRKRLPEDIKQRALTVLETVMPAECYWRKIED